MSNKTRKHIWPVWLAAVLGVAVLLAMATVVWSPGPAQAQGGGPTSPFTTSTPTPGGPTSPFATPTTTSMAMIESDSTSASGAPEIKLTIDSLPKVLPVGSTIVLYLEDDFQEPDSIPMTSVYLAAMNQDGTTTRATGSGARVYVTSPVKIKTGAYFDEDKKDIAIRVLVPDMCADTSTAACEGPNGLAMSQKVTLVIESDSGIKNPSEAGIHSVFHDVVATDESLPSASNVRDRNDALRTADKDADISPGAAGGMERVVETLAKIGLSDVDNDRGYEMTVTGSGFNNGTTAAVYVLAASEEPTCQMIIDMGTQVGDALVGSDDKVAVTFEVTAPSFQPGNVNYICMVDGEGRASIDDVEDFNLQPSIQVVPGSVASGDTVNVFARDFPHIVGGDNGFKRLRIANQVISVASSSSIRPDGSGEATFKVPGGLEGVLRIDAMWGTKSDDKKITITGGELSVSKTEALPNETLTITGNGFGRQTCIPESFITLDNVAIIVDDESTTVSCDPDRMAMTQPTTASPA